MRAESDYELGFRDGYEEGENFMRRGRAGRRNRPVAPNTCPRRKAGLPQKRDGSGQGIGNNR